MLTQTLELAGQFSSDLLIFLYIMNALHLIRIIVKVIQVPVVTLGKIDQFVVLCADAEVLWNSMFTQFIVGVIQRI